MMFSYVYVHAVITNTDEIFATFSQTTLSFYSPLLYFQIIINKFTILNRISPSLSLFANGSNDNGATIKSSSSDESNEITRYVRLPLLCTFGAN